MKIHIATPVPVDVVVYYTKLGYNVEVKYIEPESYQWYQHNRRYQASLRLLTDGMLHIDIVDLCLRKDAGIVVIHDFSSTDPVNEKTYYFAVDNTDPQCDRFFLMKRDSVELMELNYCSKYVATN